LPEVERSVPWSEMVAMARAAEHAGLDSIWLGDHLLYDLPNGEARGPWEVWTALAALACVTERVELGPLVASTSFHAPPMLAKLAATVDAISGGRLILGLGAGWNQREYTAFGFPYDRRVSRFEEAFTIIRELVRTGRSDFRGAYYDVADCVLDPRPVRLGGPPLMLGSVSPRMMRIGLPHVDAWNVWWSDYGNDVKGFASVRARVEDAIEQAGRAREEVEATAAVLVQLPGGVGRLMGETHDERIVRPVLVSELADHLRAMSDAGAAHVQLVLDPITVESIEAVGAAVRQFRDRCVRAICDEAGRPPIGR
jgi:alkanesulfonate monooxygenase SsuD/methylene tetrahydromethanopterin reductase-like flavin-dependent oxidoreductase (luciferase family)